MYVLSVEVEQGGILLSSFSFHPKNMGPFVVFLCHISSLLFFPFLLVILLFQMAPKCTAEVLPSVPKCGKLVIVLMEKVPVLDKLCSCRSYSAVVSLMLLI